MKYSTFNFNCEPEEIDDIILAFYSMGFTLIRRSKNDFIVRVIKDNDRFALACLKHGDLNERENIKRAVHLYFSEDNNPREGLSLFTRIRLKTESFICRWYS